MVEDGCKEFETNSKEKREALKDRMPDIKHRDLTSLLAVHLGDHFLASDSVVWYGGSQRIT